ncbi:MAG: hypothetical protein JNM07_13080 [Phycisphaerae bacterium]|nr:hypothetical protein [Phycisphaerae bacterium]
MTTPIRGRDWARRTAVRAQAAAAVLVGVGAIAAVSPMPFLNTESADASASAAAPPPLSPPKAAPPVDYESLAVTLASAGPAWTPRPEGEAGPTEASPAEPPPPHAVNWKYMGSISSGAGTLAVLMYDGHQHLVAEGAEVGGPGGPRLVRVDAKSAVVSEHGAERTLELTPRGTYWPDGAASASPHGATPNAPRVMGESVITPPGVNRTGVARPDRGGLKPGARGPQTSPPLNAPPLPLSNTRRDPREHREEAPDR